MVRLRQQNSSFLLLEASYIKRKINGNSYLINRKLYVEEDYYEYSYQDTIIKATGFSVVFLGAAGTLSKILTVRPDGTLSTGGSMVMILSLALGALLGELIDLDAQFERFGEWLKHKTGSDGDFMNRNLLNWKIRI